MIAFARFCTCGGALRGSARPDSAAEGITAIWDSVHSGEGHKPTTPKVAANARRREAREFERRYRRKP